MDKIVRTVTNEELQGRHLMAAKLRKHPDIFVSFIFEDPWSVSMRDQLERYLVDEARIVDGRGLIAGDWADDIQRRITRSKYVIVDVTGPSREVMFEFGFAGNKEVILCVRDPGERASLPDWITGSTVHTYAGTDMLLFVDMLKALLPAHRPYRRPRLKGVPGEAVWLQSEDSEWCDQLFSRTQNLARENRVTLTRLYPDQLRSFRDTLDYVGAQFVFACVDGGAQDYAAQFFVGDLAARPQAGTGKTSGLTRKAFVLTPNFSADGGWIAASVRRLSRRFVDIPTREEAYFESVRESFRASRSLRG